MDYAKHYGLLIKKSLERVFLKGYTENHHIKPKCMGGCNKRVNKVKLTAREHYMAHWFLVKMYPKHRGLVYGLNRMVHGQQNKYLNLSAREFEKVRILFSEKVADFWVVYYKNPENRKNASIKQIDFLKTEKGKKQIEKSSEFMIEFWKNEEYRKKSTQKSIERWKDEDLRNKASERSTEFMNRPEEKQKNSERRNNFLKTEKGKKQLKEHSKFMAEHFQTEEGQKHLENLIKGSNEYWSEEENRKKQSIIKSKKPFIINDVYYLNLKIAFETLEIPKTTISRRLKSPNFSNYRYI